MRVWAKEDGVWGNEFNVILFSSTDLLFSVENPSVYSMEVLIDEFLTIIVAGMETSANTLLFLFMELGRRPDILERYGCCSWTIQNAQ